MSKKILFVDNFKLDFDNPMSTLYANKCKKISSSSQVTTSCITDISNVTSFFHVDAMQVDTFDALLLGQRCPDFYKSNRSVAQIIRTNLDLVFSSMKFKARYMLLQDTHPKTYGSLDNLTNFINKYQLDIIFTFYDNSESRHIRKRCPNLKYYHLPHHIDTNIFRPHSPTNLAENSENLSENRPYDIILYGETHPTHYPFRKRLFELILREALKYNIKVLHITPPHDPNGKGKIFDPDKCEKGLAAKIRSAKLAIATKSKYDYLVAKYLEISACGTVVCGDMATDGLSQPEFKDNYIQLNSKMTDNQIMEILSDVIMHYDDNTNKIILNRHKYADYIMKNYNLDQYLNKLLAIISAT